jgi:hypothetical protein
VTPTKRERLSADLADRYSECTMTRSTRGRKEQHVPYDIWIDFNAIQAGLVRTLAKFAAPGTDLTPGTRVTVGDDEGTTAAATVEALGADDLVTLRVDLSSVVSREPAGAIRLSS